MSRTYYQQMGYRLREIRKARGLTQAQLGALIGMSSETIFSAETKGRVRLTDERLAALAVALGVRLEDLTADGWREACGVGK
jgi:transcriptional regulator with XRE-family HTH domain